MASFMNRFDYLLKNESFNKEQERLSETKVGQGINKAADNVGAVVEAAQSVATVPFDFIMWMKDNWQLAILGAVAILVLIKD